jgi:hypothetical protein
MKSKKVVVDDALNSDAGIPYRQCLSSHGFRRNFHAIGWSQRYSPENDPKLSSATS